MPSDPPVASEFSLSVIDLSPTSSPEAEQELADRLVSTMHSLGFIYIKNHGLEPRTEWAFNLAKEFSNTVPDEEKIKYKMGANYIGVGSKTATPELEGRHPGNVSHAFTRPAHSLRPFGNNNSTRQLVAKRWILREFRTRRKCTTCTSGATNTRDTPVNPTRSFLKRDGPSWRISRG